MKLGKRPATLDQRDLRYSMFQRAAVRIPLHFGHGGLYRDWGMLGNDQAGDCVWAGGDHETMLWNKLGGVTVTFTDADALGDYGAATGYDPADPSSDRGTYVRDAMRYRQKTGLRDHTGARHKIGAYVSIDPKNWAMLMEAVYIFGAVGIGFEFPASAMDQFNEGKRWDVVAGSPIEGGHYVPIVGRYSANVAGLITWGRRQLMTRAFYETYGDEAWAFVSPEELRAGKNERGYDIAALNAALQALG